MPGGAYKRKYSTIVFPKLETNKPQKNQSYPEVNFIKKATLAQVFSYEFCQISKNTSLHRTPLVAVSAAGTRKAWN